MNASHLKSRIPRTWGAFFGRYGNFTLVQLAAMPLLLDGDNLILAAPTASGKTEAALAPLIERYLPAGRTETQLTILYLLPTRALIADLWRRLATPLDVLRVAAAVKTHDLNTFNPTHPAELLLTTPESLDALLAGHPKSLAQVRAVIIDELHGLDGTVRGDQLRVVLNRLRHLRTYAGQVGDAADAQLQYVGISATLAAPETTAARYFPAALVVTAGQPRTAALDEIALDPGSPAALLAYLDTFRARGWRKALVFCNTRAEVEAYATAVRAASSGFGEAVFVHYSNLERERRRAIEEQFAEAEAALCFASSTLELGIDIGSIDAVLLIGAPGSAAAFTQRLGRANRRGGSLQAACFYRTSLERALFGTLKTAPVNTLGTALRPSVAVQQIFSLLRQSPVAAVRLAPLAELFAGMLSAADLEAILGHLQKLGYLQSGRPGEWRAGERLKRLVDLQAVESNPLSLHSNIQSSTVQVKIRDQASQRVVATVDRQWLARDVLTLEGRPLNIAWADGEALWVTAYHGADAAAPLRYESTRQVLSFELAQALALHLGFEPGIMPFAPTAAGWCAFHWLGDVYGCALVDLLRYTLRAEPGAAPGLCVQLLDEPRPLPRISVSMVRHYLQDQFERYERLLPLGAYQDLLPRALRRRAVVEQFDVERFVGAAGKLQLVKATDITQDLDALLALAGTDAL